MGLLIIIIGDDIQALDRLINLGLEIRYTVINIVIAAFRDQLVNLSRTPLRKLDRKLGALGLICRHCQGCFFQTDLQRIQVISRERTLGCHDHAAADGDQGHDEDCDNGDCNREAF